MKNIDNRYKFVALLVFILLNTCMVGFSQEIRNGEQNYLSWNLDTLCIGNDVIEAKFLKTNKGLEILELTNIEATQKISFNTNSPVFSIGNLTDSVLSFEFKKETIEETATSYAYLNAENISTYKGVKIKTCIKVYTGSPMITLDFFVMKKNNLLNFTPEEASLITFQFKTNHWLFNAVEFFDSTDSNNSLLKEHKALSFTRSLMLSGNILQAKDLINQNDLVIVKEAPCSYAQLHSPGYDYYSKARLLAVKGIGVSPDDLLKEKWTKTYSVALGVCGSDELDFLSLIRSYQKKLRKNVPARDDMIMMNTWGDRNKDASIGEEFIKNEIDACNKLHFTHFQIDDGWQTGRSANSSETSKAKLWNNWGKDNWKPDPLRFPNGLKVVNEYANEKGVKLGLWFNPSSDNEYARWKEDAETIISLYNDYGIRYFKIDGVKIPTKKAELNFRYFLDSVSKATDFDVVFNLDMTSGKRGGYFYFYEYGNVFLENRYTDWVNYYPFWTLRNLWQLSKYIPAEKFQIEFLNNRRNKEKYQEGDVFAPFNIPFDYTFAITMMAQPLAWFEGSNLFDGGYDIAPLVKKYLEVQSEIHAGFIFPIGNEPSGRSWTGFQSILDENSGYVLIYRENNNRSAQRIKIYKAVDKTFTFEKILGYGDSLFKQTADAEGKLTFSLPRINQFVLYRYKVEKK